MAIARIILLTGANEASVLSQVLGQHNPVLEIVAVDDRARVVDLCASNRSARLISFCSSVVVPEDALQALTGPAYNFHPGPPDRPGRYPSAFALYDKAERFGVTVHEMAAAVDSGPIVAAEWFPIPANCDLATLEGIALTQLITVFHRLAPFLALNERPLPRVFIPWAGERRTKAHFEALRRIGPGMPEDEIALRRRACGELIED